jgi:septal ring factor EnvC (AmiA/AmiB activator)
MSPRNYGVPTPPDVPKKKPRRTAIEKQIAMLKENLATQRDENDRLHADLLDARRRIANQLATLESEHTTSEHAVEEAYAAKRALDERKHGVLVGFVLMGFAAIVMWEIGFSVVRWVVQ